MRGSDCKHRATALVQERFKELEKEIKLKPFAKAALSAHAREKVDPAALAKAEAQAWLRRAVATLAEQKERIEVCGSTCCPFPIKLEEWHEGHRGRLQWPPCCRGTTAHACSWGLFNANWPGLVWQRRADAIRREGMHVGERTSANLLM